MPPPSWFRVALRLGSLLGRIALGVWVALLAATPGALGVAFLVERYRFMPAVAFAAVIVLTLACLIFVAQPVWDRLINERGFVCFACNRQSAYFGWIGPARKNQPFEFRCRECGHADRGTLVAMLFPCLPRS